MRTLIYKRTHIGDPNPRTGEFGCNGCMGSFRSRSYDAVIGIGGIGREANTFGIARKLTWIGIGPRKFGDLNYPRVRFDHFWYQEGHGPLLEVRYPALAARMYDGHVRSMMHDLPPKAGSDTALDRDIRRILQLAMAAPPSNRRNDLNLDQIRGCPPRCQSVSRAHKRLLSKQTDAACRY